MNVSFDSDDLDRLVTDATFSAGFPSAIVKLYRSRLQVIRAAADERDFYALKSWHYEKLQANGGTNARSA